ncbi:PEGA domain-containing protein [Methanospirillum hungatei]|uniref:PEGA domain-containing protein n=1 Tax=Methanospirillum hungatei TaxID=2203 RepID=UPI001B4332DB|nr:PEGA domain-containing protein [Methanospirillum hungatei]MBP9007347.1 PEGA domain-containing protein [Methanospirillum sp.]HOW05807.1 PEGA domain-containing protein [Methanospirillum hungatei]
MVHHMIKYSIGMFGLLFIMGCLVSVVIADYDYNDYYGTWGTKLKTDFTLDSTVNTERVYNPNTGFSITSTPPGAEIFVNGESVGITRSLKAKEVKGLIPGEYNVSISFPGYKDYAANYTVNEGEIKSIEAVLSKL